MHTIFHRAYYAWRRWRNPRPTRALFHVVYSDYTEQYKRVTASNNVLSRLRDLVFNNDNVRALRIYEEHFYGHKSLVDDDVDLDELFKMLKLQPGIAAMNAPNAKRTIVSSIEGVASLGNPGDAPAEPLKLHELKGV